jgi:hypothetical protein
MIKDFASDCFSFDPQNRRLVQGDRRDDTLYANCMNGCHTEQDGDGVVSAMDLSWK